MDYSRENPSPDYLRLIQEYQALHSAGVSTLSIPSEITFAGYSTFKRAEAIRRCLMKTPCLSLLDYGSGKGLQYQRIFPSSNLEEGLINLQQYWKVKSISCYDPAYPPFEKLPEGTFDAVICVDVLEHVPQADIEWILDELFAKANRLVYISVACYPAKKQLNSGENAHQTIKPPKWWLEKIEQASSPHPGIKWYAECEK